MAFQSEIYVQPSPAVEGDFASLNPRKTKLAGAAGIVAGEDGVTAARFVWVDQTSVDGDNAPASAHNYGSGTPDGLIARKMDGLITTYLADSSMVIPEGFPVTVFTDVDLWVKNSGSVTAYYGDTVYADLTDGTISTAASTAVVSGTIAAGTFSVTASVSGNVMTVTAVDSGVVAIGSLITSGADTNSTVVSQISGTAGGIGTYALSVGDQEVSSTTIAGSYGVLTVASVTSGTLVVGATLTSTSMADGTILTQLGTGTGGTGTYYVNLTQTISTAEDITATANVATGWYVHSQGAADELIKISKMAV